MSDQKDKNHHLTFGSPELKVSSTEVICDNQRIEFAKNQF